jgi:hypothetical protein
MSSTEEIEKALGKLDSKSLKATLEHFKLSTSGDKDALLNRYKNKVIEVGIALFVKKLKGPDVKACCKALGVKASGDEESRSSLEEAVIKKGIEGLLEAVEDSTLKKFTSTLGLQAGNHKEMVQQIGDEVMLTGMESFLNQLPVELLRNHCEELELPDRGSKKDLVEKLMVEIFELEPLADDDKKSKSKKDDKKKSSEKKSSEKKKSKKEEASSDEESGGSKRKRSSSSSKKSSKKGSGAKRTAWVAPPLETIAKGKHDTYTALYDNFNLPDLVKFCKQKKLVCSGKKKDVINRILAYLKTGVPEEPKKKRKRKASSSKKKEKGPAAKKQKTSGSKESEKKESTH